jgi:hypothetical protein
LSNQTPKTETNSAQYIAAKTNGFLHDEFRLAAATPVPISPAIERQFYESQLPLHALEKVRGESTKRASMLSFSSLTSSTGTSSISMLLPTILLALTFGTSIHFFFSPALTSLAKGPEKYLLM